MPSLHKLRDFIFVLVSLYCLSFWVSINLGRDSYHQFEIKKIGIRRFQIILWSFAVFAKGYRSNPPYVFFRKVILKICSKFTGEHPCRSAISIKLFSKFIEITLRHEYFSLNLLHIFRVPFLRSPLEECFRV